MSEDTPGEGFWGRWSRRKQDARAPQPAAPVPPAPGDAAPEGTASVDIAPAPAPEPPEPLDLPPLEDLTAASDFSAFLRPGVPVPLRLAALRRLWSLDPAIRDFVGPVDYGWDFNAPDGGVLGFANTLTGDVEALLRQAIGFVEKTADALPDPPATAGSASEPDAAPAAGAPAFVPPPAAPALPPPEPEPALPAVAAVRRHGRAVPL